MEARIGRLATVDAEGRPHAVPVCFATSGNRAYIALDEKPKRVAPERLRRVRNLLANPEVQLLIDHYDEDLARLAYVQLRGRACLVSSGAEHAEAVRLLREKYPQYWEMALDARPLIRIEVESVVAWQAAAP
jgi:PPOX class probable F420-dependent enzyme